MTAGPGAERGDPSDDALVAYADQRRADDAAASERLAVERAATMWQSLVSGSSGRHLEVVLSTGGSVRGPCVDVGRGWCLVESGPHHTLVLLDHVVTVVGAERVGVRSSVERGPGAVLRRWERMRSRVVVEVVTGERLGGELVEVLADAVVLAAELSPPRRLLIPLAGAVAVRGERFEPE